MGTKCEGMSRHVTRTYGRVKETSSSKAFDEILSEKINKPIAARATIHKWGKTSFTSVRGARETAFDLKRRRSEASKKANQDPFTFELEDGPSSPRKRRTQGSGVTSVVTPAIARQVLKEYRYTALARNESLKVDSADEDEEEDEDDVKFNPVKKPTKTYTRQPLCKPPPVLKAAEDSSENMAVSLPSEQSEPDTGDSMEPPKLFSQSSIISSEHSTPPVTTTETVEDTEQRLSDVSDDEVSFKQKTSKSYTSGVKTETENSSSASNAVLSAAERESAYWEQRNKYQSKTVYKSPSKTPQNPSRQETLTIIRVSPPSWFKKSAENQKTDMADIELDIISKHTDLKLKYESHNFKKMQPASKDADTFDFVAESGKKPPLVRQPLPKRKFFKTRKQNVTSNENEADDEVKKEVKNEDYVPSEIESQLVAEIFGDDQSESSHSQHSGESVESEVNDSEPEMPKLSPAPQLMELEMAPDIAAEVSDEAAETNGSQENPEPPVLKTYTRRRERPVRYSETSEPKKFFKSKSQSKVERLKAEESLQKKIFTSPKKSPSKAMYNPRTWRVEEEEEAGKPQKSAVVKKKAAPKPSVFDDDFDEDPVGDKPKVMRTVVWPKEAGDEAFTSLHVTREHKKLFTVVKNVKQAHECQEIGETQEFMDDIEYLLVGLLDSEPSSVRCLSCVSLATKCTMPSFRMHLRAHGIVAKVFSALHDAYTHSSLSLCTAAIMYMLSRDRLNMDLDRPSLDLLLKLLGVEQQDEGSTPSRASSAANKEYRRTRERIAEIILSMQGGSKQFDVETISTGNLAMESLLTLTSRRAGEVFKEELRSLGALDHIVDTVCHCAEMMEGGMDEELSDQGVEHFRKVERCLRVLEQVTYCNTDNQAHLISYKKASLISSVTKALSVCEQCLGGNPVAIKTDSLKVDKDCVGWAIYSCMLAILRVLLNLTHENEWGCTRIGEREDFLNIVLLCTLKSPQFVPQDTRFDLLVLSLGTMINLVEHCDINRRRFILAETVTSFECGGSRREVSAVEAIIGLFKLREEAARRAETETLSPEKGKEGGDIDPANQSGAWEESATGLEWVVNPAQANKPAEKKAEETTAQNSQDDEEYFTKALHKAGKHMEDSIVASYIALLLGCVIQDNQEFVDKVKEHFEGGEFMPMIKILKKFLGFMNLTTAMTTTGGKSIARVIEILEAC